MDPIDELSEYELIRQKNIQENLQKLKELGLFDENINPCKASNNSTPKPVKKIGRRRYSTPGLFLTEKRRSGRLASRQTVEFSEEVARFILGDDNVCSVLIASEDDFGTEGFKGFGEDGDDEPEFQEKRARKIRQRRETTEQMRVIPSVEDITDDDLKNVAETIRDKVYSQDGTTCHQCRQKTLDQKTVCRSKECFGVRGQFCGPCLKNRYGESVSVALKDHTPRCYVFGLCCVGVQDWTCPPCRFLCNCSICRTQAGKLPTGQMVYYAQQQGFDSVRHFLDKEEADDE